MNSPQDSWHSPAAAPPQVAEAAAQMQRVLYEVKRVVVGQDAFLERVLVALLAQGHLLIEGVPGLAKTLTVNTLAKTLRGSFRRIQFTPDLLPADLLGTRIFNQKTSEFSTVLGPVFANLLLADEINRAPAKVQSALLEAMQEKQVTIGEESFQLDQPFFVLATQNPVEQEGTYPLPEAQLDRFMMKVFVDYPTKPQELEVMRRMSNLDYNYDPKPVLSKKDIAQIRQEINQITLSETLENYIVELVFATRRPLDYALREEARYIQFGVSPRGTIKLNLAAKALAYMDGRDYVLPADVVDLVPDVLRHRLVLSYEALSEGQTPDQLIEQILQAVPVPEQPLGAHA